ncbi:MAG TPA: hypothetical protein VH761_07375 [Ilumatobacteraceae bacterium]
MGVVARVGIAVALVAGAGCQVSEGSSTPETLPPLGTPSNTKPPTTVTTVVTSTEQVATSTIALPGGACVFSGPPQTPEVTFEVGTRLYTVSPANGSSSCLTELTADNVGPIRWSPTGDRVLLNSITVFDGTQALFSGYFASNVRVSWSMPTGQALIAPAVADDHLLWRAAGQPETRTDISFLARTDVAAYHPAGKHIFAGGQANDGSSGLFVAGNRGQDPRLVAPLPDQGSRVTEIGPDPSGTRVYFIDDHADGVSHVHAVDFPAGTVVDVVQIAEPIARLTVNVIAGAGIAYRLGECGGITRTQVAQAAATVDQPAAFAALSTEPVGWIDGQQLVLSVRTSGCTGPSDLWIWNIATAAAAPLINGVDHAAVRSVLTSFGELPGSAGGPGGE